MLRELAPYAATVPQWVLIGIAGTLLTVVGITWESRLRDVRTTAGYLRQLR
ncbi:SCO7613 C-terminal domain-containing membrane protein [Nocardioides hankookensis]